jgi:hypothetical protein
MTSKCKERQILWLQKFSTGLSKNIDDCGCMKDDIFNLLKEDAIKHLHYK